MATNDENGAEQDAFITCQECGRIFATLSSHLRSKHDMTVQAYREKHDVINVDVALNGGVSSADLTRSLQDLADELDKTPTTRDMMEHGEYSTKPYYDHFGSWENALKEAGLWTK